MPAMIMSARHETLQGHITSLLKAYWNIFFKATSQLQIIASVHKYNESKKRLEDCFVASSKKGE
ncbi:18858_t:CDS:2 [Funneliformis geosporum]|uniref:18858_t:CDS:1 n=1 Tax=Funneliformis geosporum TaxID=1117311 RepID=A0A9W4SCC5_9GLOM|nr:18858_t:CDS:2 [Funneliformis geosporum]